MTEQTRFLRQDQVRSYVPVSKSGLYYLIRTQGFPKPVKIGPRMSAWIESEVLAWQQARIEARHAAPLANPKK